MQRAAARVRMANEFQAEQVLDFPLLPVHRMHCVGQRCELRPVRRNGNAQAEEGVKGIQRENVANEIAPAPFALVFGKNTDQPARLLFIEVTTQPRHRFHVRV
jgi:hypothetical protein